MLLAYSKFVKLMAASSFETWSKLVGQSLGESDWFQMDQARINAFADATLDQQFIHVDPEAAAKTPFGGTIAHGLLTLSMIPHLLYPMLEPYNREGAMSVNYGIDRLRFLQPVANNDRLRLQVSVTGCEEKGPGRVLLKLGVSMAIENQDKPALIAESLTMIIDP